MKQLLLIVICCLLFFTGCTNNTIIKNNDKGNDVIVSNIKVTINDNIYTFKTDNSNTVEEFISLLPQELTMSELNGNEKYVYLDKSLTINSSDYKHIEKGDVMLFGDNCLVIFYKSFDTSYSYTKIGHIDNLGDLGNGNIVVKFEK